MVIAGEQATREGVGATLRESKQAGGGHHAGAEIISLSLCSAQSHKPLSAAQLCCYSLLLPRALLQKWSWCQGSRVG